MNFVWLEWAKSAQRDKIERKVVGLKDHSL